MNDNETASLQESLDTNRRYEKMPDGFLVEIYEEDDYDLLNDFEKRRYLRKNETEQRKQKGEEKEREKRKARLRKDILDDGKVVLKKMGHQFLQIQQILNPFDIKHKSVLELASIFKNLRRTRKGPNRLDKNTNPLAFVYLPTAIRILRMIKPPPSFEKTASLRNRAKTLEMIRRHVKENGYGNHMISYQVDDEDPLISSYKKNIIEVKALLVMERSLRRYVPIPKSRADIWRLKATQTNQCKAKLNMILDRIKKCSLMPVCKSPFHMRPSGCPVCEVIHLGTVLDTSLYVRSKHVDTGVEVLIKLEYEIDMLTEALQRQLRIVADAEEDLRTFEDALLSQVTVAVQKWYCCYRSRQQCAREEKKLMRSLYYYRIRRLCLMKRELDLNDPFTVDKRPLLYRYSELQDELHEYFNYMFVKKTNMIDKVARAFVRKLRIRVIRRRRKQAATDEIVLQQQKEKGERAIIAQKSRELREVRRRVQEIDSRRWVCIRHGCNLRRFFSADRYSVHMSFHRSDDELRRQRDRELAQIKAMSDAESKSLLDRIAKSRLALAEVDGIDESLLSIAYEGSEDTRDAAVPMHVLSSEVSLSATHYYLELVSKREVFDAQIKVNLNRPVLRLGMLANTCEILISYSETAAAIIGPEPKATLSTYAFNASRKSASPSKPINVSGMNESLISNVHCVIYTNNCSSNNGDAGSTDACDVVVVDNQTRFGTYIVNSKGVRKVPIKLAQRAGLMPDDLLCIGVAFNGEKQLTADEASSACLVYRMCKRTVD